MKCALSCRPNPHFTHCALCSEGYNVTAWDSAVTYFMEVNCSCYYGNTELGIASTFDLAPTPFLLPQGAVGELLYTELGVRMAALSLANW